MPHTTDNGLVGILDAPPFISARSANALISENRPTRIQAETLLVLNALLDELLHNILISARSLATDRIKSDGVLKVLNNNFLAKDAVLEAELEYRSYVDGKRAEGAKVPLGLMATSRLDGTNDFPVESAYKALRTRCQYYSTLSDCDDESIAKDQNIMSNDGRPIATVTPGVAIYVTALLEFVGEHILQNVSRVIERDNSDEASLYDLRAAITEDEQLDPLYNKMAIKLQVDRRIESLESRHGAGGGVRADARIVKPWHVPDAGDFDEAAGPALFSSKRASIQQQPSAPSSRYGHASSSSMSHTDGSSVRGSMSTLRTSSSVANHGADANSVVSPGGSLGKQAGAKSSIGLGTASRADGGPANLGSVGRRQSSERSWSGVFGGIKRRNSFKQGSDSRPTPANLLSPTNATFSATGQEQSDLDPEDDFEALMMTNQTMKVSLTPNRLHTIEVAKKGNDANIGTARRRPGTAGVREDAVSAAAAFGRGPSPSPTHSSQVLTSGEAVSAMERSSTSSATPSDTAVARPNSRASLQTAMRPERRIAAPPPSAYRSPSPAILGKSNLLSRDVAEEDAVLSAPPPPSSFRRNGSRLQPRDDESERSGSAAKDLVDLFKSTPPTSTQETFGNFGSDTASLTESNTKKSAMSDRVRTLFGRKSTSSTGHGSPSSPHQKQFRSHQRADTKASLEGSQDTYITNSTTNSMEQTRSLVSPNEVPFHRAATSRSSTSTSEHPMVSADAAVEAKSTHDVTVIEPMPEPAPALAHGANGLGIRVPTVASAAGLVGAAGVVGTIAAARSPSNGSRAPSYASQTPSTADAPAQHEDALADDASSTSKPKTPDELVSRKVPWGYKRNSTSTAHLIERSSTPNSDRRRSIGYTNSNGHSTLPVRGHSRRPSEESGHGSAALTAPSPIAPAFDDVAAAPASASASSRGTNAPTAWSGAGGVQPLSRRGSFSSKLVTANQPRRRSAHLETIQLLAELERAMRNCHTVEECRALVQKAMHSDGAPLSPDGPHVNGVANEVLATPGIGKAGASIAAAASGVVVGTAAASAAGTTALEAVKNRSASDIHSDVKVGEVHNGPARGPEPTLKAAVQEPKATTAVAEEDTSLDKVEQSLVVAWLLGGDDTPATPYDPQLKGSVPAVIETSGANTTDEPHASLDSHVSHGEEVHRLASSSVASLQSNYKDAQDEVTVDELEVSDHHVRLACSAGGIA